jgi:hypothetical protein
VHASTRRLVLQGADGIAFIADSQTDETENNAASFVDLRNSLETAGQDVADVPIVVQFNKRDLPNIRTDAEVRDLAARGNEPIYMASAVQGRGVLETFFGLLDRSWKRLDATHDLAAMFGVDAKEFLEAAGANLGHRGRAAALAASFVDHTQQEGES